MKEKIGFIGLGIIGSGMVSNLLKAGFEVFVWNRSDHKCKDAVSAGAVACSSLPQLGSLVDIVQICVTDGKAVSEVLFAEDALLAGEYRVRTVVDHSTISPTDAAAISSKLHDRHVAYIDAPVSGGDIGARAGTLSIMAGGDENVLKQLMPILTCIGSKVTYLGPTPNGQLMKCANQLAVAISVAAMGEGLRFASQVGLSPQVALDILSSGAAGSWSFENYGPRVLRQDFAPGFMIKDMVKDLNFALEEGEKIDCQTPVTAVVKNLFKELVDGGFGELGVQALAGKRDTIG